MLQGLYMCPHVYYTFGGMCVFEKSKAVIQQETTEIRNVLHRGSEFKLKFQMFVICNYIIMWVLLVIITIYNNQ